MRVTTIIFKARLHPERERGAVAILVAIVLVAIVAMVVLTVDVGGLLLKRRQMVNGADAAALAAAQSCATVADRTDPETEADTNATLNVPLLTTTDGGITDSVGCDTSAMGHVTVSYSTQQPFYFAPALGFGSSGTVNATATAVWGPAGGAGAPMPVVLNLGTLQGPCPIPLPDSQIGAVCYLWYDNNRFTPSNFGFMSLSQWNVTSSFGCDHAGGASDLQSWIGGWTGPMLTLKYPDPTYVCSLTGGINSTWSQAMGTIASDPDPLHRIKFFPINDDQGQIMQGPQIDKFDIIGFAALSVDGVWKANKAPAACGTVPNASAYCMKVSWQGYQFGQGVCCGGLDLGTREVRLCDPNLGTCPPD
jgi:Flp pilus assembly protein TadG